MLQNDRKYLPYQHLKILPNSVLQSGRLKMSPPLLPSGSLSCEWGLDLDVYLAIHCALTAEVEAKDARLEEIAEARD